MSSGSMADALDDAPAGGGKKKKRGKGVVVQDTDVEMLAMEFNEKCKAETEKLKQDWE
jgi:hypothetical protein